MKKNLKVDDLMDRVFVTFSPETPVPDAVDVLGKKRLFGACVVDNDGKVLGILSEKKCIKLYLEAFSTGSIKPIEEATVMDIMYDDFKTVQKSTGVVEAAQVFLTTDFRRMPVVEHGKMVGQITRRDIIKAIELFSI
ncbi:CBS domain-containing protein [bacterium]|nr:CBS domain-containing protein [bacterium]